MYKFIVFELFVVIAICAVVISTVLAAAWLASVLVYIALLEYATGGCVCTQCVHRCFVDPKQREFFMTIGVALSAVILALFALGVLELPT